VQLASLLGDVDVLESRGDLAVDIRAVTHDSRQVVPGSLFCCVPGTAADGHDFAPAAVELGAAALLCERLVPVDAAQVRVAATRRSMGRVAAAFHGHPSRRLRVAGVTGTNGKTTVAWLLRSILEAAGRRTGLIGTLSGTRTTPEATELQAQLAELADDGYAAVAMEVSSHALAQHRVDGTWFDVVGFTNLSQDHLDFHGDMESYFAAKASLFTPDVARLGVVNADDPWGRRLLEEAAIEVRPFSVGDGDFQAANVACATAMAEALGVAAAAVEDGLAAAGTVPGRWERVDAGQPFTVVVDYAHTPAALAAVLAKARRESEGRVLLVFGCGGDRDRGKRPLMGRVAAESADWAVLTDDNPRSEDPVTIMTEVMAGVPLRRTVLVEPDRRAAIALAFDAARRGDVVVIAGKGHETGQTTGATTVPFDDRVVARELLS
jgi:UDP-N-acetylmuramoyl-L-alanyl-D-glutamate--2,6-diaminopimelate ligase